MEIRLMCGEDIPQLGELEKICFQDPWSISAFSYELNNPLSVWLVAADGDVVAGYVGSQTVMGESDMMNVAVAPEYRRQGLAKQLIVKLLEKLNERQSHSLTLEVRQSNAPAIALYEKLGFVQVGCRPRYYRNPKEDALIMRKEW